MPFQSKDSAIAGQQNKVQEVVIRFKDLGLYTMSGVVVTVDLGEPHEIVAVIDCDNSTGVIDYLVASACVTTGNSVAITRAADFAADDKMIIKYVVTE